MRDTARENAARFRMRKDFQEVWKKASPGDREKMLDFNIVFLEYTKFFPQSVKEKLKQEFWVDCKVDGVKMAIEKRSYMSPAQSPVIEAKLGKKHQEKQRKGRPALNIDRGLICDTLQQHSRDKSPVRATARALKCSPGYIYKVVPVQTIKEVLSNGQN